MPVGILSTWYSMQVEDRIDTMISAQLDNTVELVEPFFIDLEGVQLFRVMKEVAIVERNTQGIHAIGLEEFGV